MHTDSSEMSTVFDRAEELGILSYGYAWILTDELQRYVSEEQKRMDPLPDGVLAG